MTRQAKRGSFADSSGIQSGSEALAAHPQPGASDGGSDDGGDDGMAGSVDGLAEDMRKR